MEPASRVGFHADLFMVERALAVSGMSPIFAETSGTVEQSSAQGKSWPLSSLTAASVMRESPSDLKAILLEAGLPTALVWPAVAMCKGESRLLVDGTVSGPVRPHNGILARCGLAVDFLHAFSYALKPHEEEGTRLRIHAMLVLYTSPVERRFVPLPLQRCCTAVEHRSE